MGAVGLDISTNSYNILAHCIANNVFFSTDRRKLQTMTTWIIISVVLYLLGAVVMHALIDDDIELKESGVFKWLYIIAWFLFVLYIIIEEVVVFLKGRKKAIKCLLPILFISLAACNDGGSPAPDYVNRYDPEQAKYYDSIANSKDSLNLKNDRSEHHN